MALSAGFDQVKHAEYVAKGYCPSVSTYTSYCFKREGHSGQHQDIRLLPGGNFTYGNTWA